MARALIVSRERIDENGSLVDKVVLIGGREDQMRKRILRAYRSEGVVERIQRPSPGRDGVFRDTFIVSYIPR